MDEEKLREQIMLLRTKIAEAIKHLKNALLMLEDE